VIPIPGGSGAIVKVTLDLSKLVEEEKLTPAEADRLRALAAHDTSAFAINILVGFGIVAVSAGAVALVPTPVTALIIGLAVFAAGLAFTLRGKERWSLLGQICLVVGALMFSGGVLAIGKGALAAMLIVTAALAGAAIVARSSLLMVAAVLALGACLGARTGYWHATYMLAIYQPLITIVLFGLLALETYYLSKSLPAEYERLALIAARTSVFMVNFGFWVGSLWGDEFLLIRSLWLGYPRIQPNLHMFLLNLQIIPPLAFVIGWAVVLLGTGIWAVQENRRWVVNIVAVFAAIHFYTQWFERLGLEPMSVLVGGLLMLAFAIGLWVFNKRFALRA
jgi:iron complex transport system permease protein